MIEFSLILFFFSSVFQDHRCTKWHIAEKVA